MKPSLMIVAGEESGDMHAAGILAELRARVPGLSCWGTGGERLRAAGMQVHTPLDPMAVMGLTEVLKKYVFFRRLLDDLTQLARERRPDVALLVDYPGFNLRLAERLHDLGIRVVYYICPQVWAWKRSRIHKMARVLERLLVIFPFEVDVFAGTGLQVDFVGHPLVAEAARIRSGPSLDLPWGHGERVALLPGSRRHEIERILPVMLRAAAYLRREEPARTFLVAAPSEETRQLVLDVMAGTQAGEEQVEVVAGQTRQILKQARGALVASGTATIEAALQYCPEVVVYRTGWLTYLAARLLVRGVRRIGMVNIVAGEDLCPEFIQHRARPREMADALHALLRSGPERQRVLEGLQGIERKLGGGEAEKNAASLLCEYFA